MSDKIEINEKELAAIDRALVKNRPSVKNIDSKKRKDLIAGTANIIMSSVSLRSHSGPLPDVETLEGYSKIIPNAGERLMQQVEKQSEHRRKMESRNVNWLNFQSLIGQIFGFAIASIVLYACYILTMEGHDYVASIIGSTTIVSLASIFVYGRYSQNKSN